MSTQQTRPVRLPSPTAETARPAPVYAQRNADETQTTCCIRLSRDERAISGSGTKENNYWAEGERKPRVVGGVLWAAGPLQVAGVGAVPVNAGARKALSSP